VHFKLTYYILETGCHIYLFATYLNQPKGCLLSDDTCVLVGHLFQTEKSMPCWIPSSLKQCSSQDSLKASCYYSKVLHTVYLHTSTGIRQCWYPGWRHEWRTHWSVQTSCRPSYLTIYARKGAKFVFIINITIVLTTNVVIIQKSLQTTQFYIHNIHVYIPNASHTFLWTCCADTHPPTDATVTCNTSSITTEVECHHNYHLHHHQAHHHLYHYQCWKLLSSVTSSPLSMSVSAWPPEQFSTPTQDVIMFTVTHVCNLKV